MPEGASFWESVSSCELFKAVSTEENRAFVRTVLSALTVDPVWTNHILERATAGGIDVRCFLAWLAGAQRPRTYLEVGVRRGFSMAVVAARCPEVEIYGFDSWVPGYGGAENLGSEFVQSEMQKIGYKKKVHFVTGDSHKTLPAFFRGRTDPLPARGRLTSPLPARLDAFDMITIDGDHSLLGAYQDLLDTMPHCAPGGVVVFDDIAATSPGSSPGALHGERGPDPHEWGDLLGVWRAVQGQFPSFRYFEYLQNPPGVGLAVRLR